MKRVSKFLSNHYYLNMCIFIFMTVISSILVIGSNIKLLGTVPFVAFLYGGFRLFSYKNGKLPFLIKDLTYNAWKSQYGEEEADRKYEEMSIKNATSCWLIGFISFPIAVIIEFISWF